MSPSPCGLPLLWEQLASHRAQLGKELLLLRCQHRGPGQGRSDFVSRCEHPPDSAELAPGWPGSAKTCPRHWGETPSVPADLCQAKQPRVWATPVFTRGN